MRKKNSTSKLTLMLGFHWICYISINRVIPYYFCVALFVALFV